MVFFVKLPTLVAITILLRNASTAESIMAVGNATNDDSAASLAARNTLKV